MPGPCLLQTCTDQGLSYYPFETVYLPLIYGSNPGVNDESHRGGCPRQTCVDEGLSYATSGGDIEHMQVCQPPWIPTFVWTLSYKTYGRSR